MNRLIFILLPFLLFPCSVAAVTTDLGLFVDTAGSIKVEINIQTKIHVGPQTSSSFNLYVLALPFRVAELPKLQSPEDVPVAILKRGNGFTFVLAAIPASRTQTILRMSDAFSLSESPEGKALVELDLSYPFLSQADRHLLNATFSLLPDSITITLPRGYQVTEIGFSPAQFQRLNEKQYFLDVQSFGKSLPKAWFVFPNPMKRQLQIAMIIIGLMIGTSTVFFHFPKLKERSLWWSLGVLVISTILCVLIAHYFVSLHKRLEFTVFAAGFVPHILYGLGTSIYLIFIARHQYHITGLVTRDGKPMQLAEVRLWRIDKGGRQLDRRLEELAVDGRYSFRVRPQNPNEKFEVTVSAGGSEEAKSGEFQMPDDKQMELRAMDLQWRQELQRSDGEESGSSLVCVDNREVEPSSDEVNDSDQFCG